MFLFIWAGNESRNSSYLIMFLCLCWPLISSHHASYLTKTLLLEEKDFWPFAYIRIYLDIGLSTLCFGIEKSSKVITTFDLHNHGALPEFLSLKCFLLVFSNISQAWTDVKVTSPQLSRETMYKLSLKNSTLQCISSRQVLVCFCLYCSKFCFSNFIFVCVFMCMYTWVSPSFTMGSHLFMQVYF